MTNNNDGFAIVFDSMNNNYGELEKIMGNIYQYIQNNPVDEGAKELLGSLGNVARNMLFSQKELTKSYGDPSMKDSLLAGLDSKENTLSSALAETTSKTM